MAVVLVENNGASHIALVTPNKHVGALDLRIKLCTLLNTPLEFNNPMGLGMVTMGAALGDELHHIEILISHYHLVVLAPMHYLLSLVQLWKSSH
jgi:hypothetical protein